MSSQLAKAWQSEALAQSDHHVLTSFGDADDTWALTYNLFADKILGTNVIDPSVRSVVCGVDLLN